MVGGLLIGRRGATERRLLREATEDRKVEIDSVLSVAVNKGLTL